MTYLYLFSEGSTIHTLTLSGDTTPRYAASAPRSTQILLSPLTFRGVQGCTHEGEPLGALDAPALPEDAEAEVGALLALPPTTA